MTTQGEPDRSDLTHEQRARLEAIGEAKRLLGSYDGTIRLPDLLQVAVFVLDGAEQPTRLDWPIPSNTTDVEIPLADGSIAQFVRFDPDAHD